MITVRNVVIQVLQVAMLMFLDMEQFLINIHLHHNNISKIKCLRLETLLKIISSMLKKQRRLANQLVTSQRRKFALSQVFQYSNHFARQSKNHRPKGLVGLLTDRKASNHSLLLLKINLLRRNNMKNNITSTRRNN